MRGDTTPPERFERLMSRTSTRQRVVILTFATAAEAAAFDALDDDEALDALRFAGNNLGMSATDIAAMLVLVP
jgi:hypothetical protein